MTEEALIFDVDILDYQVQKLEKQLEEFKKIEILNEELQINHEKLQTTHNLLQTAIADPRTANTIWKLYAKGTSVVEIAARIGLTVSEVQKILEG